MRTTISRFLADRHGATAIEYGLIVAVLSLAVVAGVEGVKDALLNMFGYATTTLEQTGN
ncbi:Flp family type IVb pilin [Mesorhizobium sp. BAC0120]|uniref:Flp family type IVb pilin n=1 Tax=Mesorhizobium sp. BAC0120 TaxID=3090670 RepID=UPI00298C5480|nr:Flp family type IVb pilin [Mesorhizobium sp. BAC0120]MDW6026365.1 Flp family type IVb pilin [Mesorhizobium sp. BAC0120]